MKKRIIYQVVVSFLAFLHLFGCSGDSNPTLSNNCSPDNLSGSCPQGQTCLAGQCVDNTALCSALNPAGQCLSEHTCVDGVCRSDDMLCGPNRQNGICEQGMTCLEGTCVLDNELCSEINPTGLCPQGLSCQAGVCTDLENQCSPQHPNGICQAGKTCLDGICTDFAAICSQNNPEGLCTQGSSCLGGSCVDDDLLCTQSNPTGLCLGELVCQQGICVDLGNQCSQQHPNGVCESGKTCLDGSCVSNDLLCSLEKPNGLCLGDQTCLDGDCVEDDLLCSPTNVSGFCPQGLVCEQGSCTSPSACSPAHPNGTCSPGSSCIDGVCHLDQELCSPVNIDGLCPSTQTCLSGSCEDDIDLCHPANPSGLCPIGQDCLDGVCMAENTLCSQNNQTGFCPSGQTCQAGVCQASTSGCSVVNPTGICPVGQMCNNGSCETLDVGLLCDDDNPCTADDFDFFANRCEHLPVAGACSDGNACTDDVCMDGACISSPVNGCVEPPSVDPIVSPTNNGNLLLSGQKADGMGIWINNSLAVPPDDQLSWQVQIDLELGLNTYEIWSEDINGVNSASVTIEVVYDIQAPQTLANPGSGRYARPITLTLATEEPAIVYYTTNGADPDRHCEHFVSVKTMRIFDDTKIKYFAVDLATNQESPINELDYEITQYDNAWNTGAAGPQVLFPAVASRDLDIYLFGGSDGDSPVDTVWKMAADGSLESVAVLPTPRSQAAAVYANNRFYVLGGENNGIPLNTVSVYDPNSDEWTTANSMPSTRFGLAAVVHNGFVYSMGGKTNNSVVLDNFEIYNPAQDSWDNSLVMPRARYGLSAVVYENKIYVVGGEDQNGVPIAELDVFDVNSQSWSQLAPLPEPRSFAGVVFNTDNTGNFDMGHRGILVVGGRILGGAATNHVDEYIFDQDVWKSRAPLPVAWHSGVCATRSEDHVNYGALHTAFVFGGQGPDGMNAQIYGYTHLVDLWRLDQELPDGRFGHVAEEINGIFYITGGRHYSDDTSTWAYDPETGTTTQMAPLASPQKYATSAKHNGLLYIIGGTNEFGTALSTLRVYDPLLDGWTELAPMLTARSDAAAAVVDNKIYVLGGFNNGALQTAEYYDVESGQWSTTTLMPDRRAGAGVLNVGGILYVFGGVDENGTYLDTILKFDSTNESWSQASATLERGWAYGGVFAHNNNIAVLVGGLASGDVYSLETIAYDLYDERPIAIVLDPLGLEGVDFILSPLANFGSIFYNSNYYVLGGTSTATEGMSLVQKFTPQDFLFESEIVEDFESGGFSSFYDWSGYWSITTQSHAGNYAMSSGSPGHSGSRSQYLTIPAGFSSICFYLAGYSESGCDYFYFYIDGAYKLSTSGNQTSWTEHCFSFSPSQTHTFEWRYSKDHSVDSGWDEFRVDDIIIQ
jgi:N-acetylneuraminic acid mutarotase